MTEAEHPRRAGARIDDLPGEGGERGRPAWRPVFLETLAETSNVSASAEAAKVSTSMAYRARRNEPDFARDWRAAIAEGYEHLELETLQRLRMGIPAAKDDLKFDISNALRLLALHKTSAGPKESDDDFDREEEEILASIDAKLARIRESEANVTRMLHEEGVSAPRLTGGDD